MDALSNQSPALILVGAQAVFLHTGEVDEAIATETKDADPAIDPLRLADDPLIEAAMTAAGFHLHIEHPQPGSWISPAGNPVDLLLPGVPGRGEVVRGIQRRHHQATTWMTEAGRRCTAGDTRAADETVRTAIRPRTASARTGRTYACNGSEVDRGNRPRDLRALPGGATGRPAGRRWHRRPSEEERGAA
jgi:hypothetical protein